MTHPTCVPKWPPFTFGGVENPSFEESEVVLIPVPFDSTSSYRPGSRNGPESIIDASRYMELFDHEIGWSPFTVGIHTMRGIEPSRGRVEDTIDRVRHVVGDVFSSNKFPVLLGGEHTITVGGVSAAAQAWDSLKVMVLDAHCDLRNEYEGSMYSHACTNRRVLEITQRLVVAGARSCSEEEWKLIESEGLNVHFWRDGDRSAGMREMAKAIEETISSPSEPTYLSIDLDVINPSELPAVGTPEPSGPTYDDVLPLIRRLASEANLIALDIVEHTPLPGDVASPFLVAKLLYKIIGYRFIPDRK